MYKVCGDCFKQIEEDSVICPYCGADAGGVTGSHVLLPGTVLNGRYMIGRQLGKGGFGLTYVAYDSFQSQRVAIKEYFPEEGAFRDVRQTGPTIQVRADEVEYYRFGLEKYGKEAEVLKGLYNLPGIVCVHDFFYENNTAYMVMEYMYYANLNIMPVMTSKYLCKVSSQSINF